MKTLKEGIISHADGLGKLFKFSAEHTCRSMLHSLEGFANMEFVTFKELTAGFFLGFEHYLWASGCSRNTSACYFRALSIEQLRMVADADLEDTPSLGVARDLFILSYYLRGIPFIDLAYLRKTDIQDNVLCYRRSKTGRVLTITLEPWMWEIIKRYKCENTDSPYLLKIIRRPGSIPEERKQYESALRLYNKHLYRLSERLGLGVRLTSYVARHTWATLAYNEDIPVAKISAGLSHASEEITHTYLRSFSDEQLAVVNLQMAALVNPMAEKEWKRKEKGNYKVRKNTKNELHISVPIPGRKRN
ncbi:phage integrase SAM-like domain-containing protein, partial [Bacteroides cellulosilyticus]|uniref:phage integrase SAM-like domain-containing protein n=1 Tax=Bacteroides cellulosilyticus TaxID=246787 RepID=UPI0022DEF47B